MWKWRILTLYIPGTKAREKGRVLGIMGWCIHPTKQRGLEASRAEAATTSKSISIECAVSSYLDTKFCCPRARGCPTQLSFLYAAFNYFNVYMADGVFARIFSSLGVLKCSLFYVFGWIITCTLQGWRRLNSRLKHKEKFKEKLKWKIEILIFKKKITIFRWH